MVSCFKILITLTSSEILQQKHSEKFLSCSSVTTLEKEPCSSINFCVAWRWGVFFQAVHEPGGTQRVLEEGPVHGG